MLLFKICEVIDYSPILNPYKCEMSREANVTILIFDTATSLATA